MSEKTSMFELLNERLSEEEIIKITTSYDNKFNELEEAKKQRDEEIQRLNNQLQQKENTIKEIGEMLYKRDKDDYDIYTANVLCDIQSDFEEILESEVN